MRPFSTTKVGLALSLGMFALAISCNQGDAEGIYSLPRGITISVRTEEAISSSKHHAGSAFTAILETPLTNDNKVFAPAGSKVDGVVHEISEDRNGLPQITVQAVRLHLPNGPALELHTAPITRSTRSLSDNAGEVRADLGIEEKIAFLAGTDGSPTVGAPPSDSDVVLIPAESDLVFSLTSELVLPPPL